MCTYLHNGDKTFINPNISQVTTSINYTTTRAVFSFSNPGVFVVIAKLQKAEIRLRPFPEPPNSGGALAPPSTPAKYGPVIEYPYVGNNWYGVLFLGTGCNDGLSSHNLLNFVIGLRHGQHDLRNSFLTNLTWPQFRCIFQKSGDCNNGTNMSFTFLVLQF